MKYDDLETIAANSFKDFHVKGMDYLCLYRSEVLTIKVYFFDGVGTDGALVMPHDHRYNFGTTVLAGELIDERYALDLCAMPGSDRYSQFYYETPLNDANGGFYYFRDAFLYKAETKRMSKGNYLFTPSQVIHTIKVKPDTVLCLHQFEDLLPIGAPTRAFKQGDKAPPNTSGLYTKPTVDWVKKRIEQFKGLSDD